MPIAKAITGNGAMAEAMRQIHPDVVAAFPITPSTQVIEDFASTEWPSLTSEDVKIYYKLYQLLGSKRNLTTIEQKRVEALEVQLIELGNQDIDSDLVLDVYHFCSNG